MGCSWGRPCQDRRGRGLALRAPPIQPPQPGCSWLWGFRLQAACSLPPPDSMLVSVSLPLPFSLGDPRPPGNLGNNSPGPAPWKPWRWPEGWVCLEDGGAVGGRKAPELPRIPGYLAPPPPAAGVQAAVAKSGAHGRLASWEDGRGRRRGGTLSAHTKAAGPSRPPTAGASLTSCGTTRPRWPRQPLAPGGTVRASEAQGGSGTGPG